MPEPIARNKLNPGEFWLLYLALGLAVLVVQAGIIEFHSEKQTR